ncbi:uncharacterized protein LOC118190908 [Stegodyphus dumicola]|uniref:uncharacterized protein LOC118190908 n=1 Tax=Stegodyphus dumicola TaxID=202533 RepID=UPI0015A9F481|nr:uncharacterized protein LOC118190908 [Stegodyphus dumicola]
MIVTNLLVNDATLSELWRLAVIRITDPVTKKTREERDLEAKSQFQNSVSLNKEGRYEVALPWAENHLPLPSHKDLALKHLQSTNQKLLPQNLFSSSNAVFNDWCNLGVIEEVKENVAADHGHYLPHRTGDQRKIAQRQFDWFLTRLRRNKHFPL